jgi:hypothetical protein
VILSLLLLRSLYTLTVRFPGFPLPCADPVKKKIVIKMQLNLDTTRVQTLYKVSPFSDDYSPVTCVVFDQESTFHAVGT